MRNDTGWSKLTPQQKRSRVIMQLNKIEDEAVFDAREGGPCSPEVVARWMRAKTERIERRNGQPKRRARRLEVPFKVVA